MGRITENWERVMRSVPCPICGAVKGAPCRTAYDEPFRASKGHADRRNHYYNWKKREETARKGL